MGSVHSLKLGKVSCWVRMPARSLGRLEGEGAIVLSWSERFTHKGAKEDGKFPDLKRKVVQFLHGIENTAEHDRA
jgi:hypothetical protein